MENNNLKKSRNIRIFISSTFQDMQSERDYLVTKVFPTLREIAGKRDVTLTEIDLRWGITEEESQASKVVEICMDEIKNSHPFFIGLLGNRYGWCPTKEELLEKDALPPRYEWIGDDLENGLSITEIEMQYGVLRSDERVFASFYIRQNDTLSPDDRQEHLKQIIRRNERYPVCDYRSVEELGEQVKAEFIKLIDTLYPEQESSKIELERLMQQAYINDKTKAYVPNEAYVKYLNNFLTSENEQYLVISGESGMGKSSLVAYWLKGLENSGERNVIVHFAANSSYKSTITDVSERLVAEIDSLYGFDTLAFDDEKQKRAESDKLALRAAMIADKKPLLIVLDGVNQFADEGNAKLMNWLPDFPSNVKVLFSTIEGDATMQTFKHRNYPIFNVYPLLLDQRVVLIVDFFNQYRKRLSAEQLDLIVKGSNITDNTMVLMSLLEEVRCFGKFEDLSSFILSMTSLKEYPAFFDNLLKRKEELYDTPKYPQLTADILSLIALSKDGLTETELQAISGIPTLYWSQFYCANNIHFLLKAGRVTFAHNLIREAVEQRYIKNNKEREEMLRGKITAYFRENKEDYNRYIEEYPYQLYKLNQWNELCDVVSSLGYLQNQIMTHKIHDFVLYWRTLREINPIWYDLTKYIGAITEPKGGDEYDIKSDSYFRYYFWVIFQPYFSHLIYICIVYFDDLDAAYKLSRFALKMSEMAPKEDTKELKASCYNQLGTISLKRKNYTQALKEYKQELEINIALYGDESVHITPALNNIAEVYNCLGEDNRDKESFLKAKDIFEMVLEMRLNYYGNLHTDVAVAYANLATVSASLGLKDEAEAFGAKSRNIYLSIRGENDIDVAIEYNNYAILSINNGEYQQAENYARKALSIYQSIVGEHNNNTQECYQVLAMSVVAQDDYLQGADLMLRAIDIYQNIKGSDLELVGMINKLSAYYLHSNQPQESKDSQLKSLDLLRELGKERSVEASTVYDNLGKMYSVLNNLELSVENYEMSIEILLELGEIKLAANTHTYLAVAYNTFGKIDKALIMLLKAVELYDRCGEGESEGAAYANYNCGVMTFKKGDYKGAIPFVNKAYKIRVKLFGKNDEMASQYLKMISDVEEEIERKAISGGDSQTTSANSTTIDKDEELMQFCYYAPDNKELIELFEQGRNAFQLNNIEMSINIFNRAMLICDEIGLDDYALLRALLLRYLAYSYELKKDYKISSTHYESAVNIAKFNDDPKVTQRIYKDYAEFYWNQELFDSAEICYWNELNYRLEIYVLASRESVTPIMNAAIAMQKQDEVNWIDVRSCYEVVFFMMQGLEGVENIMKSSHEGWCLALYNISEADSTFDPSSYTIDIMNSFNVVISRVIDLNADDCAYKLASIALSLIDEPSEDNINDYFTLNLYKAKLMDRNGNIKAEIEILTETIANSANISGGDETIEIELYLTLARAYMELFEYSKAIDIYQHIDAEPETELQKAECCRVSGEHLLALEIVKGAVDSGMDFGEVSEFNFIFGKILLDNGYFKKAIGQLDSYLIHCELQREPEVKIQKAYALVQIENEMEAMEIIREVTHKTENWDYSLLSLLKTKIALAEFMVKTKRLYEADSVCDSIDELLKDEDIEEIGLNLEPIIKIKNLIANLRNK